MQMFYSLFIVPSKFVTNHIQTQGKRHITARERRLMKKGMTLEEIQQQQKSQPSVSEKQQPQTQSQPKQQQQPAKKEKSKSKRGGRGRKGRDKWEDDDDEDRILAEYVLHASHKTELPVLVRTSAYVNYF